MKTNKASKPEVGSRITNLRRVTPVSFQGRTHYKVEGFETLFADRKEAFRKAQQ